MLSHTLAETKNVRQQSTLAQFAFPGASANCFARETQAFPPRLWLHMPLKAWRQRLVPSHKLRIHAPSLRKQRLHLDFHGWLRVTKDKVVRCNSICNSMRASEKIAWAQLQNECSNYTKYTICTTIVYDTINRMLTQGCKCIVTEAILQHAELPRPQPCHNQRACHTQ